MNDKRDDKVYHCTPETCQYHVLTESVISDLKDAVKKLMEGQDQMKETVIQLTEAFKVMERIDKRMEKLEDLQRAKNDEQDNKIAALQSFMYKSVGALTALSVVGTALLKFFGMG